MAARWSEGAEDALRRMWADGKTASQIAENLNCGTGCAFTRNMVIGKAHRLGLPARPSPIVRS